MKRVILNIAEKPSIAKNLAYALKGNGNLIKEKSLSIYNPIFKLEGEFLNDPCEIKITSVLGHIKHLQTISKYNGNWEDTDPFVFLKDAEIEYKIKNKLIAENIKNLIKDSTDLFLWLDCDREGEFIAYQVMDICFEINKDIKVHRAQFSSVSKKEMINAFNNPIKPNINLKNAVLARQEIDLRTGAAFTRIQTILLNKILKQQGKYQAISYGPCQFPTLSLIVDQYFKNIEFNPSDFYFINLVINKNGEKYKFNWKRNYFFDKEIVKVLLEYIKEDENPIKIKEIIKKETKKFKPFPLTTIELQKLSSIKLRISSDEVMEIAEKLYTSGYISYPRTETNIYPFNFSFKYILENLKENIDYKDYLDNMKFERPLRGKKNDNSHPPIYPVKAFDENDKSLNKKEFLVYDLIARNFIANCSENALIEEQTVSIEINKEQFNLKGLKIIKNNFLEIYEKFISFGETIIPDFKEGEILEIDDLSLKNGTTTAPSLLTEADLITLMDNNKIGTDSTIHTHIKIIQKRKYAMKKSKFFIPTQLGIALLLSYKGIGSNLGNILNRAKSEKELDLISKGEKDLEEVKNNILEEMQENYTKIINEKNRFLDLFKFNFEKYANLNFSPHSVLKDRVEIFECFECDSGILQLLKSKKNNFFIGCSNFPKCKESFFFNNYNYFTNIFKSDDKCLKCENPVIICEDFEGKQKKLCLERQNQCENSIQKYLISFKIIKENKKTKKTLEKKKIKKTKKKKKEKKKKKKEKTKN